MARDDDEPRRHEAPTLFPSDETLGAGVPAGEALAERRIGPYRVVRELGHGGMGTVLLAERADEHFRKRVALKIIRGADSADVVERFKRERQILAGLEHPHIARLLDGGTTEEGLPFLVMEYVEGQPLLDYAAARGLSVAGKLRLFLAVASAVEHAHRNLVVHRDLKPGNILVAEDGTPKLLDFGIAKLLKAEAAGDSLPATAVAMTPAYASPEQVQGGAITTATDVYSLGVVLYELLTGGHPHGDTRRLSFQVLKAIAEREPERASAAVARREGAGSRLARRLRGDLDTILMMALRKEPAQRYPSVEALAEDVRRFLDGRPVKARKPTAAYRAGKFVRRHAVAVAASCALLVLLVGAVVALAVQSARVARERDTARRVTAFLVDLFRVSDPNRARGNTLTAREVLDRGAAQVEAELAAQPETRATLMDTLGTVYFNLGLYDRAAPLLQSALETRQRVLDADHPDVATSLNNLAALLWVTGELDRAEALHREALARRRRRWGREHAEVATSLNNLANVLGDKGAYPEAEALYRESLAMRRKLLGQDHRDVGTSLNNLGAILFERGEAAEAEALYREALALRRRLLGNEHTDVASTLTNLGNVLTARGDLAGAEAVYREALPLWRRLVGNDHPHVAVTLTLLADLLSKKGDDAGAEALNREALALMRKALGEEHAYVAATLNGLGAVLARRGDHAGARTHHRQALVIQRSRLGSEHPEVARSLLGIAASLCEEGEGAAGEPFAREGLAIRRRAFAEGHPEVAEAEGVLGSCLAARGRFAEAEPLALRSHAVLKSRHGGDSTEAREALERIVRLYRASGQDARAAEYQAQLPPAPGRPGLSAPAPPSRTPAPATPTPPPASLRR